MVGSALATFTESASMKLNGYATDNVHMTSHAQKKMYLSICCRQKIPIFAELIIYNVLFPTYNIYYINVKITSILAYFQAITFTFLPT